LHFDTPECMENFTRLIITKCSLNLNQSILTHPKARIIGYVAAGLTMDNALNLVPEEFRKFLDIMGKAAADALPKHSGYDHEICWKEGEKTPWGPIYPLSKTKLETH